jgi:multidrug resistance efflux pump
MKLAMFSFAVVVIAAIGLAIDSRSRASVVHPVVQPGQGAIFATGRIEGASQEIEMRFPIMGQVKGVLVEEGRKVRKGDTLLSLDDDQFRQEVALAEADVDLAQARLERLKNGAPTEERNEAAALCRAKLAELADAQRSSKRLSRLSVDRAVPQQQAEQQEAKVASLSAEAEAAKAHAQSLTVPARDDEIRIHQAQIEAARARLELAKVQLARTQLQAPCDGEVLKLNVRLGELAGPTSGEPAVILADTRSFRVRAFVEEMDASRVKVGMPAKLTVDGLGQETIAGQITRLSPRMGRKQIWSDQPAERYDTKTREVWVNLPQGKNLVVGLRVDVLIDAASAGLSSGDRIDVSDQSDDAKTDQRLLPVSAHLAQTGPAQ